MGGIPHALSHDPVALHHVHLSSSQVNGHCTTLHPTTAGHGPVSGLSQSETGKCTPISGGSPAQTAGPASSLAETSTTMSSILPVASDSIQGSIPAFQDPNVVTVDSVAPYNGHISTPVPSPPQLPVSASQTEVTVYKLQPANASFKRDPMWPTGH